MAKEVKYEVPHSRLYEGIGEAELDSRLEGLLCGKNKQWIRAFCRVQGTSGGRNVPQVKRVCSGSAVSVCSVDCVLTECWTETTLLWSGKALVHWDGVISHLSHEIRNIPAPDRVSSPDLIEIRHSDI